MLPSDEEVKGALDPIAHGCAKIDFEGVIITRISTDDIPPTTCSLSVDTRAETIAWPIVVEVVSSWRVTVWIVGT